MVSSANLVLESLVSELRAGIRLISSLSDEVYSAGSEGTVGTHFRHNLDFVSNFLKGFEDGHIDYNARERNTRIETDRQFAVRQFEVLIDRLEALRHDQLEKPVLVRSEIDTGQWLKSGAARELEFVHSHTVHHHALIASKLSMLGVDLSAGFGVAPSTMRYWHSRDGSSAAAGSD